jgi:hypothetical protein
MVHDEKLSDIWWHETDTLISQIYDVVFFERLHEIDLKNVVSISENIKSSYREALLIDEHRVISGVISNDELKRTKEWNFEGSAQVGGVVANYRYLVTMDRLGAGSDEMDLLTEKIKIMLSNLREHTRDRYLFDRFIESREQSSQ